mmetsp:Transcript_4712/g.7023  ORF Transcript_4712/g.7023 Transcript_4712/m.7023 type:complete len:285 (+) Transcript_4712:1172-2026(+)
MELFSYPTFLLRNIVQIQSLTGDDRISILQSVLEKLGTPWVFNTNDVVMEEISLLMKGFTVADIYFFSKWISASVYSQYDNQLRITNINSTNAQFKTRIRDILNAARQFTPTSSIFGNKAKENVTQVTTWNDVGGFEDTKRDVLGVLRLPTIFGRLYRRNPVRLPRAVLLYGPPGCGKSLIAQAAGGDFGKNGFICVRGPQLLDKYIGASEKAVRDIFAAARQTGRSTLLFFDEFESLAAKRGKDNTGVTDRVVNQLLTFIDGVEDAMGSATSAADTCNALCIT